MPTGLTEAEERDWCKNKKDYTPLIRKRNRSKTETDDMNRMAVEYHEWQHWRSIKNKTLRYNPNVHTSKIFDEFKRGGAP